MKQLRTPKDEARRRRCARPVVMGRSDEPAPLIGEIPRTISPGVAMHEDTETIAGISPFERLSASRPRPNLRMLNVLLAGMLGFGVSQSRHMHF